MLGHLGLVVSCPVVEHLEVATVGIGVGCATGKLIVELIGRHDIHAHRVAVAMHLCQALSLRSQLLARRDDDDEVGLRVGVVVLVGNGIDILGHGEGIRSQARLRFRALVGVADVVHAHRASRERRHRDRVGGSAFDFISILCLHGGIIRREAQTGVAEIFSVEARLHRSGSTSRHSDGEVGHVILSRGVGEDIGARLPLLDRIVLEEVATALIPGEVVHLAERMIVVGQRIAVSDKPGGVHHERCLPVGLGKEIVAIV